MKKAIIFAIAATAFTTPALAEPFSGFHAGIEAGHDAYEVKAEDVLIAGPDFTVSADGLSGNGLVGGVFAGYDFALTNSFFAGVEASINTSGAKISASATDGVDSISAAVKARESLGLSARLGGMLNDSTGLYARLGWARTKFKVEFDGTTIGHDHQDAFQYGAGIETRIGDHASLRVEYTRLDYGSAGLNALFGVSGIHVNNDQVRAGASYRF